jgi:Ca2+-binding RTX toxin-like protein
MRTNRYLRPAPLLVGAALMLSGMASISPAQATEDPNPVDTSTTIVAPMVFCFGRQVDMWVPNNGAVFYGDNQDNVIMGSGGPDTIYGGGGIDRICQPEGDATSGIVLTDPNATDGVDVVHGEGGGDYIDGGSDGDVIYGEVGEDFLHGGDNDALIDILYGGDQNDLLFGESGDDGLNCGGGFDTAYGGPGNDFLNPSGPQASCNVYFP